MNATYTFDTIRTFRNVADVCYRHYGVILHLVDITRERWAYVEGAHVGELVQYDAYRVVLDAHHGIIVYGFHSLSQKHQQEVARYITCLIEPEPSLMRSDIVDMLRDSNTDRLFLRADALRIKYCGTIIHLRGLIEFSNYCRCDCLYCGLRCANKKITRYRMTTDEIIDTALIASQFGYKTVVLQSGEDPHYTTDILCALIRNIKRLVDCAVTLCVGERSYEEYKLLKEAGADRYLLRFETSDPILFKRLKPHSSLEKRLMCLTWLKELGYQVGSGMMVGIPGQTLDTLADDIMLLRELDLDMIGLGPFIPHPDTPLAGDSVGTVEMSLKIIALARMVMRNTHIPATTAIGSIDPFGRQMALQCGANVLMPNITPQRYRKHYQIYPGKICMNEEPTDCSSCVTQIVSGLNRKIAQDYGHSLKMCV